jgi:arylsulfatase A-like enzyme
MIAYGDAAMQKVYDRLDAQGLLDDTWIIISFDHGDYTGEKGLFTKNETCYECLLHVPLIICPPKNLELPEGIRGSRVADFVDLIDLLPTVLEITGEEVPEYAQGRSLLGQAFCGLGDRARTNGTATKSGTRRSSSEKHKRPNDALFAQVGDYHGYLQTSFPGGMPASGRHPSLVQAVRTHRRSYISDPDYGDEAYDLGTDPNELDNLLLVGGSRGGGSSSEGFPEWAKALRERIHGWEETCLALRKELGVVPGDRGFYEGWE